MKNIIIVGCGCSGAILSRKIAEELDCPVQIVERRPHIAGNMYVESRRYGNIFLCGRLAEFRYIDIHTCVEHALEYFENIKTYLTRV